MNNEQYAIIGMSARLPGDSSDVNVLWQKLLANESFIQPYNHEALQQRTRRTVEADLDNLIAVSGHIEKPEFFDNHFFGINNRKAKIVDPQCRILLRLCWEALEHSGNVQHSQDCSIGTFITAETNHYLFEHLLPKIASGQFRYSEVKYLAQAEYFATYVAYHLNFTGPAMNIQTACSGSLVSVAIACDQLRERRCDIALAGGVALNRPFNSNGYQFRRGGMLSPDGVCRPFDERANGTVFSDGGGIVALKRLDDALADNDTVYATIDAAALNNDGKEKAGYAAPSIDAQIKLIETALAKADLRDSDLFYIETHGSGTSVGDEIEATAIGETFQTKRSEPLHLGALKATTGHTDLASGVLGLIKTALSLYHGIIPSTINHEVANSTLKSFSDSIAVNTSSIRWTKNQSAPKYCGISSFGIGGTNVHLIVKEHTRQENHQSNECLALLPCSAKTKYSLVMNIKNLLSTLRKDDNINLQDLAYTMNRRNGNFTYRMGFAAKTMSDLFEQLEYFVSECQFTDEQCPNNILVNKNNAQKPPETFIRWCTGDDSKLRHEICATSAQIIPLAPYAFSETICWTDDLTE